PGAHPVAVASYSWWKRRFAGDRSAVGRTLAIDSTVYTIIGVAPPEFFGTTVGESPDLWIPTSMIAQLPPHWGSWTNLNDRDFQAFYVLARLRPGISRVQAGVHLNVLFKQILHGYVGSKPSEKDLDSIQHALIELTPGGTGLSELRVEFSRPLEILMGAVGLVLLIACANVANLLLGRAASRHREIAVRLAIGAGRVRLVRQMLTESILLSMIGGALGVAFAWWASRLLLWMVSTGPEIAPIRVAPDARVLAFAFALSLATGILFGCAPALRATSFELGPSLKEGRGSVTTHARSALAKALIVGQVALSVVLLVGAVLFVRSLVNLRNVDTGFQTENVLQLQLDTANAGYKEDDPRLIELYAGIEQKVSEMPGVRSASFSMFTFNQGAWTSPAYPHGHQPPPEQDRDVHNNVVGPSFFTTMGLPVVLGRAFGPQDTAKSTKVAVISETMARNFFPNESPLGQRFGLGGPEHSGDLEVVGVVKDAKYERLGEHRKPAAYYPYTQHVQYLSDFEVRLLAGAGGLVPQIRQAIREVDPHLPIAEISTLSEQVDRSLANQKLVARLSSFFGLLALLLASIGIYGILSYAVARRTNEIGLRMALGARRSNVIWLVMRDALMLVVIGFAVGVPAAAASERLMSQMLFGLGPIDALSIAAGVTVLAVTAAMAAYLPARRASRVDPTVALRYE
ncbi:MAG TPA: ABC transporter permease, partial [Bryobacteraceae bacterium]|nr:ABC transporter permease [Bryobacteraceae bacterium]